MVTKSEYKDHRAKIREGTGWRHSVTVQGKARGGVTASGRKGKGGKRGQGKKNGVEESRKAQVVHHRVRASVAMQGGSLWAALPSPSQ